MASRFNIGSIFADLQLNTRDFSRGLDRARRSVRGFSDRFQSSFSGIGRTFSSVAQGATRMAGRFAALLPVIVAVQAAIVAFGAAVGAIRLVPFAAALESAERSFGALARSLGGTGPQFLKQLQVATRGTVSELELFRVANQAVLLGVGATTEQIAKLAEGARRLGRAAGRTTAEAFGDLATGIGRQSKLILDNLGIIVSIEKANQDYARALGRTAASLTDAEKKQAFFNATVAAIDVSLAKLGPDFLSFSDVLNQLISRFSDFGIQVTRNLTPALRGLLESLNALDLRELSTTVAIQLTNIIDKVTEFVNGSGQKLIDILSNLLLGLAAFTESNAFSLLFASFTLRLEALGIRIGGAFVAGAVKSIVASPLIKRILAIAGVPGSLIDAGLNVALGGASSAASALEAASKGAFDSFVDEIKKLAENIAQSNRAPNFGASGPTPNLNIGAAAFEEVARQSALRARGAQALLGSGDVFRRLFGAAGFGFQQTGRNLAAPFRQLFGAFDPDSEEARKRAQEAEDKAIERRRRELARDVEQFTSDLSRGFVSAIQNGSSTLEAAAETFARAFQRQLDSIIANLSRQLVDLFKDSGLNAAGAIGNLLVGAGFLATQFLSRGRSSSFTEIPVEELATSQAAVRGVVAGPSSVAIAEVGAGIREANRGVESLLSDILQVLRGISAENRYSAGGLGTAGAN